MPSRVSCYITELDWVNRFVRQRSAGESRASSLHADATARVLLSLTHILGSISTNQSCVTRSYLAYLLLAGDKCCALQALP